MKLCVVSIFYLVLLSSKVKSASSNDEYNAEEKVETNHKYNSLDLFMFVCLLILTILTIWAFKHLRFRFVHETGLAIIYGLFIGLIIKYTVSPTKTTSENVIVNYNFSSGAYYDPKDYLKLNLTIVDGAHSNATPSTQYYRYVFVPEENRDIQGRNEVESELARKATFDPEIFFNVILPPIIFNAGYNMKRKHFFKNFGAIASYAFIGTSASSLIVGGLMFGFTKSMNRSWSFDDCFLLGSILSATDPVTVLSIFTDMKVDADLNALVFGESVLNDAVAIVLFRVIKDYKGASLDFVACLKSFGLFLASFFFAFDIGCLMGCLTAIMTKFTHIRNFPMLEVSLFCTMSYCTFVAAEAAGLTGIVALLFCGICQAHYTFNNLSEKSKAITKEIFELLSFLMENFVFAYIGVSIFLFSRHYWDPMIIFLTFVAIIVARLVAIYPLTAIVNLARKKKIPFNFQHLMMFSGIRGAVAFALAIQYTHNQIQQTMFSTTLIVVIVTVIFCGALTTHMLVFLKIRVGLTEESQQMQSISSPSGGQDDEAVNRDRLADKAKLVRIWSNIDSKLVKPFLTHARPPLTETLPNCCVRLARLLSSKEQLEDFTKLEDDDDALLTDHVVPDHQMNGAASNANLIVPELNAHQNSRRQEVIAETHPNPFSLTSVTTDDSLLDSSTIIQEVDLLNFNTHDNVNPDLAKRAEMIIFEEDAFPVEFGNLTLMTDERAEFREVEVPPLELQDQSTKNKWVDFEEDEVAAPHVNSDYNTPLNGPNSFIDSDISVSMNEAVHERVVFPTSSDSTLVSLRDELSAVEPDNQRHLLDLDLVSEAKSLDEEEEPVELAFHHANNMHLNNVVEDDDVPLLKH